jgi:hypothetical protein
MIAWLDLDLDLPCISLTIRPQHLTVCSSCLIVDEMTHSNERHVSCILGTKPCSHMCRAIDGENLGSPMCIHLDDFFN